MLYVVEAYDEKCRSLVKVSGIVMKAGFQG